MPSFEQRAASIFLWIAGWLLVTFGVSDLALQFLAIPPLTTWKISSGVIFFLLGGLGVWPGILKYGIAVAAPWRTEKSE